MKKFFETERNKKIILLLLAMEAFFWGFSICTRTLFLQSYMVNDYGNGGMDYFNMLALLGESDPYCKSANYPAMCFLILKFFYHMIPLEIVKSENGINGMFLRNYLPAQLPYMIFLMMIIIVTYEMIKYLYMKNNEKCNPIIPITLILSGPMMFAIERGNFILLAFLFSFIYITLYDHSDKRMRIIAYVALALAAAIKIYPAVFGLLTLIKKRHKETILLGILGITIFIVPFFMFNGIASLRDMLMGITASSNLQGNGGCGYNFSMVNLIKIIQLLFSIKISDKAILIIKVLSILVCILLFILAKEEWKKVYALSLIMIWIPEFSYTYTLIFLLIPFILLLNEKENSRWNIWFLILFVIILSPYALPVLTDLDITGAKLPLTVPTVIINFAIIILTVVALVNTLIDFKKEIKEKCIQ